MMVTTERPQYVKYEVYSSLIKDLKIGNHWHVKLSTGKRKRTIMKRIYVVMAFEVLTKQIETRSRSFPTSINR